MGETDVVVGDEGALRADAPRLDPHAELGTILGQVADGITVQDPSGALVYANDAAARLIGFADARELLATPIDEVMTRFEVFDEHGAPLPLERLPGRLALEGTASEQVISYRVRGSAGRRWSFVRSTPILDDDGDVRYAVNAFQDITERKRAEEWLRVLADAGDLLAPASDLTDALAGLPDLVVPGLADAASVWIEERGTLRRRATATITEEYAALYEQMPRAYDLVADAHVSLVRMFRRGEPFFMPDVEADMVVHAARETKEAVLFERLGVRAAMAIPLRSEGRRLGLLTFSSFASAHFSETDFEFACELGKRVAAAIDRTLARKREELRLRLLSEASEILASSLDYRRTLDRIAHLLVPSLTTACAVWVEEDGRLVRVAQAHEDPELEAAIAALPAEYDLESVSEAPMVQAYLTGKSFVWESIPDDVVRVSARDDADARVIEALAPRSVVVVPLLLGRRPVGALSLVSSERGHHDENDRALAEVLGRRIAVTVDNARVYREAEQRAQAAEALAFTAEGVCLLDVEGRVRLWNPAAEMITGLRAGAIVGKRLVDSVPSWARVEDPPPGTSAHVVPVEIDGRERWLSVSTARFEGGIVHAFRDLTSERALEQLKSDFISTVSHELRTPLAAIYGASMTLQRADVELGSIRKDELLNVISNEAERLARTINDVLWASRLESGTLQVKIESCDGGNLAANVVAAAQTHLPSNLSLELDVAPSIPRVAADPDKVRQVLANLLDNAVKYSPDGGEIRVSVEPTGRFVRFAVCDEGLGIPAAERERIFEKFYRLDPNLTRGVGGTGLGLYICRELIQRMGGRVTIEPNGSKGSTFVVELPVAEQ